MSVRMRRSVLFASVIDELNAELKPYALRFAPDICQPCHPSSA